MSAPRVVVFSDFWRPGFRAGGPIVSLTRLVAQEASSAAIRLFTRDHDLGDTTPYPDVVSNTWTSVDGVDVGYLAGRPGLFWAVSQLRQTPADLYYFNSLHSPLATLLPLLAARLRLIPRRPILLAPRGECSPGAQQHKSTKKTAGGLIIRWLVPSGTVWHASSPQELADIQRWSRRNRPVRAIIEPDPPPAPAAQVTAGGADGRPLRVVFASRIHPMKGLDTAIEVLGAVTSPCEVRIHGIVEDADYWDRCQRLVKSLPGHINVEVGGPFTPDEIVGILADADVLLLPSRGENFGQVIAEALSIGCPVAISTRTPWQHFVGPDLGIASDDASELAAFIDALATSAYEERRAGRTRALAAYRTWFNAQMATSGALFARALTMPEPIKPALFLVERATPQRTPTLNALADEGGQRGAGADLIVAYVSSDQAEQGWGALHVEHPHVDLDRAPLAQRVRIVWEVATRRYRIVVAMGYRGWVRTSCLLAAKAARVPVATRSDTNQVQVERQPRRRSRRAVWRALLPKAATAWTIGTQNERFWTEEIGLVNTVPIPYEVPLLPGNLRYDEVRAERRSDPERLTFLYVGRLVPIKRVDDAVAAFLSLPKRTADGTQTADWRLRIVGDGEQASALRSQAGDNDRIEFLGSLTYVELGAVFADADVLVLPSAGEPWGLVVNEALGYGLRVIASDQVGAAYDLITPDTGVLTPVGDVVALARAMAECAEHPSQRSRVPETDTTALMAAALRSQ